MTADAINQTAFARGRVLHEATGGPLRGEVEISAQEGPIVTTVHDDGRFMLSGDLEILFPRLTITSYQLHLTVRGRSLQFRAGFAELPQLLNVPAGARFDPPQPTAPDPLVDLGDLRLPADPMHLRGRVTDARNPGTPVPGAAVQIFSATGPLPAATTDAQGDYRFTSVVFTGPARARCTAAGFGMVERELFLNLEAPMHVENFQLPPP